MTQRMLRIFKCSILDCKYYTRKGKEIGFVGGKYITDNEDEVKELEAEIKEGHPHIYIDAKDKEISAEDVADPMAALRAKIIAEYEANKQKEAEEIAKGVRDFGDTAKVATKPVSSSELVTAVGAKTAGSASIVAGNIKK